MGGSLMIPPARGAKRRVLTWAAGAFIAVFVAVGFAMGNAGDKAARPPVPTTTRQGVFSVTAATGNSSTLVRDLDHDGR
jgi:hypothetical protein